MRSTARAVFAATPLTSITPARLKGRATRPPFDGLRVAACHAFCVRRRAPQELATLEGRPPWTAGFVEAAAKLRPTVALVSGAGVEGEGTAAARQRQAARGRA
jgi:hypothetical protein